MSRDERRLALVTGGGSGIGRATAIRLARRMTVAVCDVNGASARATADLIRAGGGEASEWTFDLADHTGVVDAVSRAAEEHGRLDAVVAAGGYSDFAEFDTCTVEQWDQMMAVHGRGVFSLAKASVPSMAASGFGRIVLISSVAYTGGAHPHYAAAKASMVGFAKSLCKTVGARGITVNVVAPGVIETPLLGQANPEIQAARTKNALGRVGQPEEVASIVDFLCTEDAGFITGEVIHVNGGSRT
jgi:2-hydroxycyclohexanecarboxyl-CoA dehydrogenase